MNTVILMIGESWSGRICTDRMEEGGFYELGEEKGGEPLFNESRARVLEDRKIPEVDGDDEYTAM